MPIQGAVSIAVIDNDDIAVTALLTGEDHSARSGSHNRASANHIDTFMASSPAMTVGTRNACPADRPCEHAAAGFLGHRCRFFLGATLVPLYTTSGRDS